MRRINICCLAAFILFASSAAAESQAVYIPPDELDENTDLIVDGTQSEVQLSGRYVCRDVRVSPDSSIRLPVRSGILDATVSITCRQFLLEEGGLLEARVGQLNGPVRQDLTCIYGTGGSYGGLGSDSWVGTSGTMRGLDITRGRAGGDAPPCTGPRGTSPGGMGGAPGGVLVIDAEVVSLFGDISADGRDGLQSFDTLRGFWGGGGSGGGILILAGELQVANSTRITADGGRTCGSSGSCSTWIDSGGGGRIKIFYERGTVSPEAVIEAKGYEDGTVWIQQVPSIDQLLNPNADLNDDGVVDEADLHLLMEQWHWVELTQ